MGRAHHRAIYFIGRTPGISVSELLAILNITKQSLSRVLSALMENEFRFARNRHHGSQTKVTLSDR
jgi:DNA-binding MarR family transcriptional regulator